MGSPYKNTTVWKLRVLPRVPSGYRGYAACGMSVGGREGAHHIGDRQARLDKLRRNRQNNNNDNKTHGASQDDAAICAHTARAF